MTGERDVLITVVSRQQFQQEKPETTKLVTQGVLRRCDGSLELSYAESELTGLSGTTTTFHVEPSRLVLTRSGGVTSQMVFAPEQENASLYDMGFGALLVTVRTQELRVRLNENGGSITVRYAIAIEEETTGQISYRITVRPIWPKK